MCSKVDFLMDGLVESGRNFDAAVNILIRNHACDFLDGIRSETQFKKKLRDFGVGNPDIDFVFTRLRKLKEDCDGEKSAMPGMRT